MGCGAGKDAHLYVILAIAKLVDFYLVILSARWVWDLKVGSFYGESKCILDCSLFLICGGLVVEIFDICGKFLAFFVF